MNITDYMKQMKKASKSDPIPGTVKAYLDEDCPTGCGRKLIQYNPCCGSPNGYKGCACGYKVG